AYLVVSALRPQPFTFRGWEFRFPAPALSLAQVAISSLDWALASSVLYLRLPPTAPLSYPQFVGVYLLAQLAGLVSQVPGGLGVFETVMLLFLAPAIPPAVVLGSLFAYRGLDYLLPLGVVAV